MAGKLLTCDLGILFKVVGEERWRRERRKNRGFASVFIFASLLVPAVLVRRISCYPAILEPSVYMYGFLEELLPRNSAPASPDSQESC